jgi:hypothetical protein
METKQIVEVLTYAITEISRTDITTQQAIAHILRYAAAKLDGSAN